jgi:hypothetical protein
VIHAPAPQRLPSPEPPSPSAPIIRVVNAPVQSAGVPTRLRRVEYGGPTLGLDVRLFFDRHILAHLLEVAEASVTARAMIDGPALVISPCRGGDGNAYEVWTLVAGGPARPEPGPLSADPGPAERFDGDVFWDMLGRPVPGGGHWAYGKPTDTTARMYLDAAVLRTLQRRAQEALSGRVQLDHVGLVIEDYLDEEVGQRFSTWTITCGGTPRPEPARFVDRRA